MKKLYIKSLVSLLAISLFLVAAPFTGSAQAASNIDFSQLEKITKTLTGTKYVSAGTTTRGFDCSGYVSYVFDQFGVDLPRSSSGMHATGEKVEKKDLQPGDLVFFNTSGNGVSHVGIYIGNGKFSHASSSKGVMVSELNDKWYWGSKYMGAKRVANVTVVASAEN